MTRQAPAIWNAPRLIRLREGAARWRKKPSSGIIILIGGTTLATLLAYVMNRGGMFSNPGLIYLPLIALLAYHWNWRYAAAAVILQLSCVYLIFIFPAWTLKALDEQEGVTLITLTALAAFVMALVQVARQRRSVAERELTHFTALYRIALTNSRLYHAAREQTQELDAIFESLADGVIVVNQQGEITRENGAARQIRESLAQSPAGDQILKALLHAPAAHALEDKVQSDSPIPPIVVMDMQRELRELTVSAFPLLKAREARLADSLPQNMHGAKSSHRPNLGAVIVWHDVTETHRLFSERRAHAEAERIKDEFISIAAHELRNPMAVLKGFTHMLIVQSERGRGASLDDWQKEALQDIDQATTRLVELTDDLLDVTRLQAGQLELHQEPINLVSLTSRIIARLQITTERHHITLSTAEEPIISIIDQQRIEQVLTNIINNAIKYSPAGGAIKLTLSAFAQTQLVQLSVQDHGIGIPAEQQNRIFGRFMRADNARAHGIRGTGLGLFLCRVLLERQNGRIWFESSEGEGSTFSFSLPLITDQIEEDGSLTSTNVSSTRDT